MFGLQVKKGHFPHEFNVLQNQDYVREFPCLENFGGKFMTEKNYRELCSWHAKEKAKFKARDELWDNVLVLRLGWLQFVKVMREIMNGCLLGVRKTTLASFTNLFWCTTISWNVIGVIPLKG